MVTAGVITYYEIKDCHEPPWPPRLVATGAVFALLDAFSLLNAEISAVIAVGFMLAMIVNKKLNSQVQCDPTKRGCQCASQATDMVGIPPPAFNVPGSRTGPGLTPIEPPRSTPLPNTPSLPEAPAIPEIPL